LSVFFSLFPFAIGGKCEPHWDDKVICRCVDWTSTQVCAPMVLIASREECEAAGGAWGQPINQGNIMMDPLHPLVCGGNWMNHATPLDAERVFDSVMRVREKSRPAGIPLVQPPVFGQGLDTSLQPTEPTPPRDIILSPSFGPTSGGVWVQVIGAGSFHTPNSLQCKLDLIEQFCYSNHYAYSWCYFTPKCAGVYDFTCHNGPLEFRGKYAVVAKTPWVTSVYPFSGDTHGGTAVTVRGWNFEPHCPSLLRCRFGTQEVAGKYYTSSSVMCIAPCNQRGFSSVEVSNDGGHHWSMSGVQFGYIGDDLSSIDEESLQCTRYLAHGQSSELSD